MEVRFDSGDVIITPTILKLQELQRGIGYARTMRLVRPIGRVALDDVLCEADPSTSPGLPSPFSHESDHSPANTSRDEGDANTRTPCRRYGRVIPRGDLLV